MKPDGQLYRLEPRSTTIRRHDPDGRTLTAQEECAEPDNEEQIVSRWICPNGEGCPVAAVNVLVSPTKRLKAPKHMRCPGCSAPLKFLHYLRPRFLTAVDEP